MEWTQNVDEDEYGFYKDLEWQSVGHLPWDRWSLWKKMAEAVGKARAVPLSLFFEMSDLEIEADLARMSMFSWWEAVVVWAVGRTSRGVLEKAGVGGRQLGARRVDRRVRWCAEPGVKRV